MHIHIHTVIHTYIHTLIYTLAACIDQDSENPAEQLNGSLSKIIGSCDFMVTPIHDPEWKNWSDGSEIKDAYVDYKARAFEEYLGRGWCRIEMFFNANVPVNKQRQKVLGGSLKEFMKTDKQRPHLLFGTREMEMNQEPIFLRALKDKDEFDKYDPRNGELSKEVDRLLLKNYVDELWELNEDLKVFLALEI
jgi:hypothetical protein